jgi:hypothetical protein
MSAYYWEHIKSCSWFSYPIYVFLAITLHINSSIISHVKYWWNCKFRFFLLYLLLWYLLVFSKHLKYLLSIVDICDLFNMFVVKVHQPMIRLNWAFGHEIKQKKSYWYFAWLYFGYHVLLLNIYFMCICFFLIIIFMMLCT